MAPLRKLYSTRWPFWLRDRLGCDEILKLLCNLLSHLSNKTSLSDDFLAPLFQLLRRIAISSPPLQSLVSSLINCLVCSELGNAAEGQPCHAGVFPSHENNANVDHLTKILSLAAQSYGSEGLDKHASPLVQLLLKFAEVSPPQPMARFEIAHSPFELKIAKLSLERGIHCQLYC